MRSNTLFWGFVLIAAGALFLLSNLGIIQVNVWNLIWPLVLIALGLSVLLRTVFRRPSTAETVSIPLSGAEQAVVRINHGAGELNMSSGAGEGVLLEGSFAGGINHDERRDGNTVKVNLRMPSLVFPFFWAPGDSLNWDVHLSPRIALVFYLETGANRARIDLSDLLVNELRFKSGASATDLVLPENAGKTDVRIESGAASLNIRIPTGVAAQIRSESGLSSINVDRNRFPKTGGVYRSEDYDTAPNKADIRIQTGVGSVQIS